MNILWLFRQILNIFVLGIVYLYRYIISPLTPSSCRHVPTCSQYMVEAVKKYGPRGFLLGLNRIGRCHPWGTHGYDPVPTILVKKYQPTKKGKTQTLLKD